MAAQSIAATDAIRAREDRAIYRALQIMERRALQAGTLFDSPSTTGRFFRLRLGLEVREHFEVAFLSNRHQLLAAERLFSGSIATTEIHPRVVLQRALQLNAAAVIFAHNHPSGDPTPSKEDFAITRHLENALRMIDVRVLDHVVVAAKRHVSMATDCRW